MLSLSFISFFHAYLGTFAKEWQKATLTFVITFRLTIPSSVHPHRRPRLFTNTVVFSTLSVTQTFKTHDFSDFGSAPVFIQRSTFPGGRPKSNCSYSRAVVFLSETEVVPTSERSCFHKNWTMDKIQKREMYRLDLHHCQNPTDLNWTPI